MTQTALTAWTPTSSFLYAGAASRPGPVHFFNAVPTAAVHRYVEEYWAMEWDLPPGEPRTSLVLPSACINALFFATPQGVFGRVTGVRREALPYTLAGKGRILGIRFRPGGFFPFYQKPVSAFTDASILLPAWLGEGTAVLAGPLGVAAREPAAHARFDAERRALDAYFVGRLERKDPDPFDDEPFPTISTLVNGIAEAEDLPTVRELITRLAAGSLGGPGGPGAPRRARMSERTLHRLFERTVGVGPKLVLRTHRFQQVLLALDCAPGGEGPGDRVPWARLAADLGYVDQAHFIRDFKAITGRAPSELVRFL
jgi:hypothetical protein